MLNVETIHEENIEMVNQINELENQLQTLKDKTQNDQIFEEELES